MKTATCKTMIPFSLPSVYPKIYEHTVSPFAEREMSTARLELRPVSCNDLNDFIALFTDSGVMKFIGIEAGYIPSREEIAQLLDGAVQVWQSRGCGRWSLFDRTTSEFIGFCGFRYEEGEPELICALHKQFWGQGIAEEAARACLRYGFDKLGFTKVKAFTRPDHKQAQRVLSKLNAQYLNRVNFHGVDGIAYQFSSF